MCEPVDGMSLDQLKEDLAQKAQANGETPEEHMQAMQAALNALPPNQRPAHLVATTGRQGPEVGLAKRKRPEEPPPEGGGLGMAMGACPKCNAKFCVPVQAVANGEFDKCENCGHEFVPGGHVPKPTTAELEGATQVNEDENAITEFEEKLTPGTRVEYMGSEYLIIEQVNDTTVIGMVVPGNTEEFTREEFEAGDVTIDEEPQFKIPVRTQYPPQVFILSWIDDGHAASMVFKDLGALKEHNGIDGDAIMEAISDPGEPIKMEDGRTLTLSTIEGAK